MPKINLFHTHIATKDTVEKAKQGDGQGFYCVPTEGYDEEDVTKVAKDPASYPDSFKATFPTETFEDIEVLVCEPAPVMMMIDAATTGQYLSGESGRQFREGLALERAMKELEAGGVTSH